MRVVRACMAILATAFQLVLPDVHAAAFALACPMSLLARCGDSASASSDSSTFDSTSLSSQAVRPELLVGSTAAIGSEPFIVTKVEQLGETRFNGNVFDYAFRVTIKNTGLREALGVTVNVVDAPGTEVVRGPGAPIPRIAAGATMTLTDRFILRRDRTRPFQPNQLKWQIQDEASEQLSQLQPAEIYMFPLAELNIPDAADSVVASGAVSTALLKDGTLRFATPGDTGRDQDAQFVVKADGATIILHARILSARPTEISLFNDGPAYTDRADPPMLTISGFGPDNRVTGSVLKFKLTGVAGVKLQQSSDVTAQAADNTCISLKQYWNYDAADSSFSIAGDALRRLMSILPVGTLDFMANFVSDDAESVVTYEFRAMNARTTLKGQFVTPHGAKATGLAGKSVRMHGVNEHLRKLASVDADGAFEFDGVIPDIYFVTLGDLEHPDVASGSTYIYPDSTQVTMTFVYPEGSAGDVSAKGVSTIAGWSEQNGTPPPVRAIARGAAAPAKKGSAD